MTRAASSLAPFLLLALLLAPARASEPPEWRVPGVTRVVVDLAEVARADADTPLPHRFVASLDAQGALHFGTAARYVAGDGDAGRGVLSSTDGQGTNRALQAWSEALRRTMRKPGMRMTSGLPKLRVLLRADRRRPWIEALWLLEAAAAQDIGIPFFQFAVRKEGAATDTAWRLPYEIPLGVREGDGGPELRERYVHIDLDESADRRRLLRVQATAEPTGSSVRRKVAELILDAEQPLDLQALLKTLAEIRAPAGNERGYAVLVTTIHLTAAGVDHWTCGDVLPLLATLGQLDAEVYFEASPATLPPTPAQALHASARGPFASPPKHVTRRDQRWEKAVDEALRWLAAHQSPDGLWEAAEFPAWCDGDEAGAQRPEGAGAAEHDVGVTGLALLAFLGAGYGPRGQHPYVETVRRGLLYLKRVQDAEGCFGPRDGRHWIYDHGAATWAMVEAAGMTESRPWLGAAQRGLDLIAMSRNPYSAWRYGVKPGDNDTSVCGWMLMPISLARTLNADRLRRGLEPAFVIDEEAFDGAKAWLDKITDPDNGRTGYIQRGGAPARPQALIDRFPGEKSESTTGLGITLRVEMGEDPTRSRVISRGLQLLLNVAPVWHPRDGSIDMYHWYWGSLATWQCGRRAWKRWAEALDKAVVSNQRKDTTYCMYRGSWDPIGPWGETGGRVYSTAVLALSLETPTRYARRFGR